LSCFNQFLTTVSWRRAARAWAARSWLAGRTAEEPGRRSGAAASRSWLEFEPFTTQPYQVRWGNKRGRVWPLTFDA